MRDIKGSTKLIALLGNPVEHSKSPYMHNLSFEKLKLDYAYMAFKLEKNSIKEGLEAMKLLNVKGFNLTMPLKEVVMEYLDEIDLSAKLIGSVNTVLNKDGKFIGFNTDGKGFIKGLENRKLEYKNKKIVILGAGGAAKSIGVELALKGAGEILIMNRSLSSAKEIEETINKNIADLKVKSLELDQNILKEEVEDASILINTTCLGMGKTLNKSIVENKNIFHKDLFVSDVIYYPMKTKFLSMAEEKGCQIMNGLDMLIYQGALAFKIWTDLDMPKSVIETMQKEVI